MHEKSHENDRPLVSIVSPCFNGEKYLKGFLDSVLAQTYPSIQLILVDDCSVDATNAIAQSYESKFVAKKYTFQYIRSNENKGAAAAINLGLPLVKGDYFMWADSDDILLPQNISEKVEYLECNRDADCVFSKLMIVSENDLNKSLGTYSLSAAHDRDQMIIKLLKGQNAVWGPGTILIRHSSFLKAIPTNSIFESTQGQNYQLLLPIACCCRCDTIESVLQKYVIHPDSHSHKKRTFKEKVQRHRDFYSLVDETLFRVPGLTSEERRSYVKISRILFMNRELNDCLRHFRIFHYFKTRTVMKNEGLHIDKEQKLIYYYKKRVKRRILALLH